MARPVTRPREADYFVGQIEEAVRLQDPTRICRGVKSALKDLASEGASWIPDDYMVGSSESYSRRILHRCPEGSYSVMLMVWRPGQGTSIHDHAGKWCVECVVRGEVEVVSYHLKGRQGDLHQFEERDTQRTEVGDVGVLIPPNEYHRLANVSDQTAATIHVYEGELLWCNTFLPTDTRGTFRRERCTLTCDD